MTEPAPDPPEGGPKLKKKTIVVKKKVVRRVVKRKDGTIVSSTIEPMAEGSTHGSTSNGTAATSSTAASASGSSATGSKEPPARTVNTRVVRRKSLGKSSVHSVATADDMEPEFAPGREPAPAPAPPKVVAAAPAQPQSAPSSRGVTPTATPTPSAPPSPTPPAAAPGSKPSSPRRSSSIKKVPTPSVSPAPPSSTSAPPSPATAPPAPVDPSSAGGSSRPNSPRKAASTKKVGAPPGPPPEPASPAPGSPKKGSPAGPGGVRAQSSRQIGGAGGPGGSFNAGRGAPFGGGRGPAPGGAPLGGRGGPVSAGAPFGRGGGGGPAPGRFGPGRGGPIAGVQSSRQFGSAPPPGVVVPKPLSSRNIGGGAAPGPGAPEGGPGREEGFPAKKSGAAAAPPSQQPPVEAAPAPPPAAAEPAPAPPVEAAPAAPVETAPAAPVEAPASPVKPKPAPPAPAATAAPRNSFAGRGGGAFVPSANAPPKKFGGPAAPSPAAAAPIKKVEPAPPTPAVATAPKPAAPAPAPKPAVAPAPKPATPAVAAPKPVAAASKPVAAKPKPAASKPATPTAAKAAAAPAAGEDAPVAPKPRPPVKRKVQASGGSAQTSNNVYIFDPVLAWIPARLLGMTDGGKKANVKIPKYENEKDIGVVGGPEPKEWVDETIDVTPKLYGPKAVLPLQNVDKGGALLLKEDMVDLAFLHEAAILFNIKARHVQALPYTRTGDIVLAVNPYQWLEHLYTHAQQMLYAETLVWDYSLDPSEARRKVPPHVYETSALTYRALALSGGDQSILVSGESGAGKTETVKICMNHIALVQGEPNKAATDTEGGGHKAAPTGVNMVVQRVVQSNPILEVFGNAKTRRNDNSSRFGKYVQLQFDRDDVGDLVAEAKEKAAKQQELEAAKEAAAAAKKGAAPDPKKGGFKGARVGIRTATAATDAPKKGGVSSLMDKKEDAASPKKPLPKCRIAGSKCEVYLLEKSRIVMHDTTERTYHVFYAIVNATDADKKEIWSGLIGKGNADFKYVGFTDWQQWDGIPDTEHYALTRSNLATIGVTGDKLMALMQAITVVLQCGQLVFGSDPSDKEKCVVTNKHEFDGLSELSGVPANDLLAAFTQRTMVTRGETFIVPLKPDGAKDSCDAFAKEIYSKCFLWLVREINAVTCAEDNYDGEKKSGFVTIGLLDIFGFESFPINGFEQLCINYANEKLQAKFTKDIFKSVEEEYRKEGISLQDIRYDDNSDVLELIESRSGLCALLDQECMRPKGNAKEFVYKVRQEQKASPCLIADKHEAKILGPLEFGVHHYAGKVIYNADEFLLRNTDTISPDLYTIAEESSNVIISKHLKNEAMMNEKPGTRVKVEDDAPGGPKRSKSGNASDTLWNKFRTQLSSLMKNLGQTQSRYIRCIKPNTLKQPLVMQHLPTVEQLRCAGVVAAVTITRSAFPSRLDHKECYERYHVMYRPEKGTKKKGKDQVDMREELDKIMLQGLEDFELDDPDQNESFVVGKTRIYFRAGVMEYLEQKRAECWDLWSIDIQRVARGFLVRMIAKRIRMERFQEMFKNSGPHAVPIQRKWRKIMEKKREAKARFEKIASFAQNMGQGSAGFKKPARKVGKLKINPLFGN